MGAIPILGTTLKNAALAQLVEQLLCKHQVSGSIPEGGSISWISIMAIMSDFQSEDESSIPSFTTICVYSSNG